MKCSIQGCSGEYEQRLISQTYERHGKLVVVRDIPAEVCPLCGDILIAPQTARAIEQILNSNAQPSEAAPVYRLAAV